MSTCPVPPTDAELLDVLCRPSGAGRWKSLGRVRGWGPAVALVVATRGPRAEFWFKTVCEAEPDGPTLFDESDHPEPVRGV